ncbi:MAG: signal peptidase II [Firmicutes bacterium]|nr:signal peptidase II [Bacillota bacterium]
MKKSKRALLGALFLILITLGLDQWSKMCIVENIQLGQRITIIKDFFWLAYIQNTGAGFSIFEGYGIVFFSVITIAALAMILYLYLKNNDIKYDICYALIFSGAIGNFIDRLVLGYVRDFFSFNLFGWYFPIFNVADICISVGFVILICLYAYEDYKEKQRWKQEDMK